MVEMICGRGKFSLEWNREGGTGSEEEEDVEECDKGEPGKVKHTRQTRSDHYKGLQNESGS